MPQTACSDTSALPQAGADPDQSLHDRLLQLRQHERSAWRCLRTLAAFSDFAHLARRLHCSHDELRTRLQALAEQLGAQHLRLEAGRVHASGALLDAIARVDASKRGSTGPAARPSRSNSHPNL